MTVTTPPRRPEIEQDRDLAQRVADLEALIEEARRRARRRRTIYAAIVLTALGAAAWASFDGGGSSGVSLGRSASGGPSAASVALSGAARWRPLNGPQGGSVFALAIAPTDSKIVYAAGYGRVFKSSNGGESWTAVSGEPWQEIESFAIDPMHAGTVYVGSDRGVGKTVDGGRHWRMVNTGLFDPPPLPPPTAPPNGSLAWSLMVDSEHPATVYATTGRGLYRTRNGGKSWQTIVPASLRSKMLCRTCPIGRAYSGLSFAIDPHHPQTIYATGIPAAGLMYQSADGGDSWRRITMATPLSISALALTASGALLASDTARRGMFRSTDGGRTWAPDGLTGATIDALTMDPGSGAIYATTGNGSAVFQTTDGGESWQSAPANLAWFGTVTDPNDPATVYATTNDGIVKSVDRGNTWATADNGFVATRISSLALAAGSPATLYAGTAGTAAPVFKSTDRGRTWQAETAGLGNAPVNTLAVDPQHKRTLYAVQGRGLFKSSDAGVHWSLVPITLPSKGVQAIAIDPQHTRTIYVADCGGTCSAGAVQKTGDGGASWRPITGIPWAVQSLAINPQHPDTVFAGTARGGIFRSTDAGSSWQRVAIAPGVPAAKSHLDFPYTVVAIAIDPLNPATIYAASRTGGIIKTSDGGQTWAKANAGLTNRDMYALAVDPRNPQILFASTEGGVFRSNNTGESWQPYGRGLPAGGVAAFAIDPASRTLYAGTNLDGVDSLQLGG